MNKPKTAAVWLAAGASVFAESMYERPEGVPAEALAALVENHGAKVVFDLLSSSIAEALRYIESLKEEGDIAAEEIADGAIGVLEFAQARLQTIGRCFEEGRPPVIDRAMIDYLRQVEQIEKKVAGQTWRQLPTHRPVVGSFTALQPPCGCVVDGEGDLQNPIRIKFCQGHAAAKVTT